MLKSNTLGPPWDEHTRSLSLTWAPDSIYRTLASSMSLATRRPLRLLLFFFVVAIIVEQIPLVHDHAASGLYSHECSFARLATGPAYAALHDLAGTLHSLPEITVTPPRDRPAVLSFLPSTLRSRAPPRAC